MLTASWWSAGVKFLRLNPVALDVPPASRCALVGVTHLHITNPKTVSTHRPYLSMLLWLPNLAHLVSTHSGRHSRTLRFNTVACLGIYALALQLQTVAFFTYDSFYNWELTKAAPRLTKLRTLVLASPVEPRYNSTLAETLRALPPGLRTLDISPQPLAVDFARAAGDSMEGRWEGVSRLRVVRLPSEAGLVVQPGHEVGAGVEQLRRVAQRRAGWRLSGFREGHESNQLYASSGGCHCKPEQVCQKGGKGRVRALGDSRVR